jgi:putative ABC transport system permease protein
MWSVALKGIWARKLRFISTTVAIVLGVGFMAGTYVFTDTVGTAFNDLFASVYAGTDTVVRGVNPVDPDDNRQDGRSRLSVDVLDQVRAVATVDRAEGFVRGYAQLVKRNNKPLGGTSAPTFGLSWVDDPRLTPYRIFSGRPPTNDDEIAIDKASARIGKWTVGDTIKVLSQAPTSSYRLVGVLTFGTADSAAATTTVAFTPARAAQIFDTGGRFNSVLAAAKPGVGEERLTADIAAVVSGPDRQVLTGTEVTKLTQSAFRERLKGFRIFLQAFAYLALFVGMYVISNTFAILVAQRSRELALLRALGARRAQVLRSVLVEALAIGLVASVMGLLVGLGLAVVLRQVFAVIGFDLPGNGLIVLPRTVIVSVVVGTVITVVSALLPAWRAGRLAPLAALRDVAIDRSAQSRARLVIGVLMALADQGLIVKGLSGNGSPLTEGAAFALSIITVTVLGPTLARPFGKALGAPLSSTRPVVGALATANAIRNPRRTARTALALTIGLAVVAMVLTFVASFNGLVSRTIDGQFKADYILSNRSFTGFSPEVARRVATVPGVSAVSGVRFGSLRIDGVDTFSAAFDTARLGDLVELPVLEGRVSDIGRGAIAIGRNEAAKHDWTLGDSIPVIMATGPTTLKLAALMDDTKLRSITQGGAAVISLETYDDGFVERLDFQVYVKAASGADLDAVATAVEAALVDYPTAEVLGQAEYKRSISDQLDRFVLIVFVLLALSVFIALFGVANTLLLSIHERTREIGLLRAVGMTAAQVRATVRWESVIMALFGVVVGLVLGATFGFLVMRSLRDDGFTEIVIPRARLAMVALVALAFGVLAGIRPAYKAAKLNVLTAIGVE